MDRESLKVLDQNGSIRTVLPTQVTNKITPRRDAVATDRNGAEIRHGDTVREVYGEQRSGVILHIHRSFLFLHNKAQAENSGIIVVRTTNVVTVSAKGGRSTGPDLTKMNPALMRNGMPGAGGMGPPKTFGRDRMIGKTVMVRKGPFKGLVGIVKDSSDAQARVELHSKNKLVSIPKEILVVKDPVSGATVDSSRGKGGSRVPYGASSGAASSGWQGGRTPMAASGSRTPAWGMSSSARSKSPWASCFPSISQFTKTYFSTCLGRNGRRSHTRLENGRITHVEPLRRKPHRIWRLCIRFKDTSLERWRSNAVRFWRRIQRLRRLCGGLPNSSMACVRRPYSSLVRGCHRK